MVKIKYTAKQIRELENNKYVKSCSNKNITFTKECKIRALELEESWIFRKEIFKWLWFPDYVVNTFLPTKSINRWKNNVNKKWIIEEKKWRQVREYTDISKMTKDEYIEYLEAKLCIIEELKKIDKWDYP